MEMRLAAGADLPGILQYDCHIPPERVTECLQNGLIYVLLENGKVVGILRYSLFWQTIPFLDLMYLDEHYRGRGYGRQMMALWETDMARKGHPYVMLSTQEDELAKFFYEKLGYRRIGSFLPPEQAADELVYLKETEK